MRNLFILICFLPLHVGLNAQSILDVVQFYAPSVIGFDITLLDSSPSHVLLKTNDANFSTSLGYESTSEYDVNCLLLCDLDLNVVWQKNLFDGDFMDAALGDDCVYTFGVSQSESFIEDEELDFEAGRFASKLDLDGNWEWMKFYPSLFKHSAWANTIETDSENNVLASVELWNYEHPASTDTLTFANEQCFCSALAMDFSVCSILLKWDEDGNELWSRVLDSAYPNYSRGVALDDFNNTYVTGYNENAPEPAVFANEEFEGGQYILSYSENGQEQWIYYFSNQVPWYNASVGSLISNEGNSLFFKINHNTDSVVTTEETIFLDAPIEPLNHQTIHEVDLQTGEFISLEEFGHFAGSFTTILLDSNQEKYIIGRPVDGFIHDFPPHSFEPDGSTIFIKKSNTGIYTLPFNFIFEGGFSNVNYLGRDRIFFCLSNSINPVNFTAGGEFYEMDSKNYVIILDSTTEIQDEPSSSHVLKVYPNPTRSGQLTIESSFEYNELTVFDQVGRVVFVSTRPLNSISVSDWKQGTYLIQLISDNGVIQERFVVVE